MDFPYPEDRRFYAELTNLTQEIIHQGSHSFASGASLISQLQRLLAKISHKDWTPLHRDQIRSVVEALMPQLPLACAGGCLSELVSGLNQPDMNPEELQHLLVMDNGVPVADPVLLEFDIQLTANTASGIPQYALQQKKAGKESPAPPEPVARNAATAGARADATAISPAIAGGAADQGSADCLSQQPEASSTSDRRWMAPSSSCDSSNEEWLLPFDLFDDWDMLGMAEGMKHLNDPEPSLPQPHQANGSCFVTGSWQAADDIAAPNSSDISTGFKEQQQCDPRCGYSGSSCITADSSCLPLLSPQVAVDCVPEVPESSGPAEGPPASRSLVLLQVRVPVSDAGLLLHATAADGIYQGAAAQRLVLEQLRGRFLQLFPCFSPGRPDDTLLLPNFQSFLTALVQRRRGRVEQWASDNMR